MTMSVRSPCTRLPATGVRSAVPRPLTLRNTIRVRAAGQENEKTHNEGQNNVPHTALGQQYGIPPSQDGNTRVPHLGGINDALGNAGTRIADHNVFNPVTELINSRAAMLGFAAAVITEVTTHQSVASQLGGHLAASGVFEAPSRQGQLFFALVVILTAAASWIPRLRTGETSENRSFFPFTSTAELWIGRTAQIGFAGLLITEFLRGGAGLFA